MKKKWVYEIDYGKDLIFYVDRDGDIKEALAYLPAFDEWIDVTDRCRKNEKTYEKFIAEKIAEQDEECDDKDES